MLIQKFAKGIFAFIATLQLASFIVSQFDAGSHYFNLATLFVRLCVMLLAIRPYFQFNVKLHFLMYRKQKMAYKVHACRHIALVLLTTIAILLFINRDTWWLFDYACKIEGDHLKHSVSDFKASPESFCTMIDRMVEKPMTGTETIIGNLIYDIVSILPYWAFLLFHDPHDCFKCLGKDPERNYSMFQFNRAELLKLRYCAKFGSRET